MPGAWLEASGRNGDSSLDDRGRPDKGQTVTSGSGVVPAARRSARSRREQRRRPSATPDPGPSLRCRGIAEIRRLNAEPLRAEAGYFFEIGLIAGERHTFAELKMTFGLNPNDHVYFHA